MQNRPWAAQAMALMFIYVSGGVVSRFVAFVEVALRTCEAEKNRGTMPPMTTRLRSLAFAVPVAFSAITVAASADAFCGFYVAGADQKLFNNATMVVLMREGTRTVLSMQNNYQGPPENFAMVVPVPVVLHSNEVIARHKAG